MIKRGEIICYKKRQDFRDVVLEDLLFMFSEKGMVEIIKFSSKKRINKIAISSTIDTESNKIINILIKGHVKDLKDIKPINKKIIKPLYLFLDAEVLLYAKLKKLKFKKVQEKKDNLSKFIDSLEKKHPEIKRAIINGYLELGV
ncbi:hypothetical protein ACFLZF_00160 [Nanoarchaeota archaeon]